MSMAAITGPAMAEMLLVADSHAGFGLTWDQKRDDTNIWILHTTAESEDTVVYSAVRSVPANHALQRTAGGR